MIQSVGIVAIYAGANGLLLLALSYNVGRHRDRTDSLTPGAMGDDVLVRAIRAHGNAAEYMPLAIVMLHGLGALFTFGRVAQAFGMTRDSHPNAIRFIGNFCTGLVYLIGSIACIYYGVTWGTSDSLLDSYRAMKHVP